MTSEEYSIHVQRSYIFRKLNLFYDLYKSLNWYRANIFRRTENTLNYTQTYLT